MEFTLKVAGGEEIELGHEYISAAIYRTDTPDDSYARSTEVGSELRVSGRVMKTPQGGNADETRKLAIWSLVPAGKEDCYRRVELDVVVSGAVVRKLVLPNAFVVDYSEDYGTNQGVGLFNLVVRQKKDKIAAVKIEGGYVAE
jgi:hypothetical protein